MAPDVKKACERCGAQVSVAALFCPMCGQPRATREDDQLIGQVVGDRYLLQERLGQGGSGTIYLAEHITVKRRVAVKILHHELSQDDLAIERFRREATTVGQIDNEHIVEVLDFGRTEDGRLFLAMELLEGETLAAALKREGKLPIDTALDILIQVGEGLMEAHATGYVHRDLRPANIYLARRRGRERFVKLLDFGLAKLVEREGEAATSTLGMTFGDPSYMAPEQARGAAFDRRADIYALGCMAHEMLTGRPPFVGQKVFDVLTQHLEAPVPPPSRLRPDVPLWLDAVILRALSKKADDRFITVYRFVEALQQGQATGKVMTDDAARSMPPVLPPPPAPRQRDGDAISSLPAPGSGAPSPSRRVEIPAQGKASASSGWYDESLDEIEDDDSDGALAAVPAGDGGAQTPVEPDDTDTDRPAAEGSSTFLEPPRSRRGLWIAGGIILAGAAAIALFATVGAARDRASDHEAPGAPAAATAPTEIAAATPPAEPPAVVEIPEAAIAAPATPGPEEKETKAQPEPAATKPETKPETKAKKNPKPDEPKAEPRPDPKARATQPPAETKPKVVAKSAPAEEVPASRGGPPVFDFRPKPASPPEPPAPAPGPATAAGDGAPAEEDNGQAAFYVKLGNRALRAGDTASAAESFNKARLFDRTSADAIAGLGAVAMAEGKYADATVHLEAAARLKPRSGKIQTLRGQAYLAAGRRSEAAAAFRRALEIDPGNGTAARGLSEAGGSREGDDDADEME